MAAKEYWLINELCYCGESDGFLTKGFAKKNVTFNFENWKPLYGYEEPILYLELAPEIIALDLLDCLQTSQIKQTF